MAVANENQAAVAARAFATYALVPYLGILFCPGALVMASVAVVRSYALKSSASRASSIRTMLIATLELAAHLALWWMLYKVPNWSAAL
jgi:hypothetical protein